MSRRDAALGGLLRHQEEVEAFIASLILNETRVDDATWWRVIHLVVSALNEHPLMDPLVHNSKCDCWWMRRLVVERQKSCLKLSNLLSDELVSHLLADSISVDNDLLRPLSVIMLGKFSQSTDQTLVEISFHKLLIFLLNQNVREERSAMLVG